MPTLTATVDNTRAYVLVVADWTDTPAVEYARVWRVNTVTGQEELLRPYIAYNEAGDLLLTCGIGVWWDTEPPLNTAITYRTEAADVLVNTTTNPSFETGVAPWIGTNLTQSALFAHDGTFSGRSVPAGPGNFEAFVAQTLVPVDASKDVTASAWVLSPQGWNSVSLKVIFMDAAATELGSAETLMHTAEPGIWRYLELTATPPAGTTNLTYLGHATGTPPATTLFYWDELESSQLQPVAATAVAGPVTIVPTSPVYLKDPLNPCNDQPMTTCMPGPQMQTCDANGGIMLATYGPRATRAPGGGLLEPENQPARIPIVRPRRNAVTSMTVFTRRFTDRDSLNATLAPGTVLFLQAPAVYGISDRYLHVHQDYAEDRLLPDHRIQTRQFTLPHALVNRPAGPANGPCGSRMRDLCNVYATWDAVQAAGLTWQELIEGAAG